MATVATEVGHFAEFCEAHLVQSVDAWDGEPLALEPWQLEVMGEALAYGPDGWPVWNSIALILPRKNGKTTLLAALALYRLLTSEGMPEILLAASSDRQAGRLFDAAATFVRRSAVLSPLCRVRDHAGEIVREDGLGKILRMSSDPARLHGYNPSLVIVDELAQWTTPSLRRAFAALTSGGGARQAPQTFSITTAGEAQDRADSILGRMLDGALAAGVVELSPGRQVVRVDEARLLAVNYEAPTHDPHDVAAMKLANPASWISEEFLARQAANPELTKAEVLQLHGCVWAAGDDSWIDPGAWEACADPGCQIPDGAEVWVGVDAALTRDTTAVAVAWPREDGRVQVEAYVWAAMADAVAHELSPGGRVSLEQVEQHVLALAERFSVREVAYDPRFMERSSEILSDAGLNTVAFEQASGAMADAYQGWFDMVIETRVAHPGDRVLSAHVLATAAEKTERGWKVRKLRHNRRIDAHVACVMAAARASANVAAPWVLVV